MISDRIRYKKGGAVPDIVISISNFCFAVSLMDSLDSTVGQTQREKIKQIRQKQIDVPVSEDKGR